MHVNYAALRWWAGVLVYLAVVTVVVFHLCRQARVDLRAAEYDSDRRRIMTWLALGLALVCYPPVHYALRLVVGTAAVRSVWS